MAGTIDHFWYFEETFLLQKQENVRRKCMLKPDYTLFRDSLLEEATCK